MFLSGAKERFVLNEDYCGNNSLSFGQGFSTLVLWTFQDGSLAVVGNHLMH